jgi:hypothetical protein
MSQVWRALPEAQRQNRALAAAEPLAPGQGQPSPSSAWRWGAIRMLVQGDGRDDLRISRTSIVAHCLPNPGLTLDGILVNDITACGERQPGGIGLDSEEARGRSSDQMGGGEGNGEQVRSESDTHLPKCACSRGWVVRRSIYAHADAQHRPTGPKMHQRHQPGLRMVLRRQ